MARNGAKVVIHGRDEEKGEKVISEIKEKTANVPENLLIADFSSLEEVEKLAQKFKDSYDRLDVLVNNAGGVFPGHQLSEDGIEKSFAVNHLSHFLLTHRLLDLLKKSAPSRIVNVGSEAHSDDIDFDHLTSEDGPAGYEAYNQSKLANILFTYKLAEKLEGTGVTVNCLHPGAVRTDLVRKYPILGKIWKYFPLFISSEEAAETVTYLAASPEVEGVSGKYFNGKEKQSSSSRSYDDKLQEKLWKVSKNLAGIETF